MSPAAVNYSDLATLEIGFQSEHVLSIALNRPKALNSFNPALWRDFKAAFDRAASDSRVRCIVLSANGRAFTAGLDLSESILDDVRAPGEPARKAFTLRRGILELQKSFDAMEECNKPVICVLHGAVIGAGVDLASAADIRYASEDCFMSIKEVDVALAADVGTLARFPRLIGNDSVFRELAYTARNFSAKEAKEMGFLGKVLPNKDAAMAAAFETAAVIASKSPVGVQGTKNVLLYSRDKTVEEGNRYVANWNAFALQTSDLGLAMAASLKKKTASYPNL